MQAETKSDFQKILASGCRAPDIPESADAYGWLIGSWDLAVRHYAGVDVAQRGTEIRQLVGERDKGRQQ